MPTAAKLVAAIMLAITGWFCAELIKPMTEEGRDLSGFAPICAAVGAMVGWRFLGPRADQRMGNVLSNTFTMAFVQIVLTVFVFALLQMLKNSLRKVYHGPIEALQDVFVISGSYYHGYFSYEVVAAVLLGGALSSWCAFMAARKWG